MRKLLFLGLTAAVALASCSKDNENSLGNGFLQVSTELNTNVLLKAVVSNPNDFKLTIAKKSDGLIVKEFGKVSDAGSTPIEVPVGTYTVKTSSNNFTTADWDSPLYEASQEVTITANNTTSATLKNTQANAGVKVTYTDAFKAQFTEYQTLVESAKGNLTYIKTEGRTGYFAPGNITLKVTAGGTAFDAITKTVNACELVTVRVDYSPTGATTGKITLNITVDNTVTEKTEDIVITPGSGGTNPPVDPGTGSTILYEDFATATGGVSDGSGDALAWTGNSNFTVAGKVYQTNGSIRFGSSTEAGSITSKVLDLSKNNGKFTITFKSKGWVANGTGSITVNGEKKSFTSVNAKDGALVEQTISFTNGNSNTTVIFETGTYTAAGVTKPDRFFIDDIKIIQ